MYQKLKLKTNVKCVLTPNWKIIKILKEMIDIVILTEEITHKFSPHKIRLKANTKTKKLRSYRLTKLKSEILKELKKIIKKGLIE